MNSFSVMGDIKNLKGFLFFIALYSIEIYDQALPLFLFLCPVDIMPRIPIVIL